MTACDCATGEELPDGKKRMKRRPSKYNLHMKECLKKGKGPIQARFKKCAAEYKRKK